MKRQKLNFRFHNPNPPEVLTELLIDIMLEVNKPFIDKLLLNETSAAVYVENKGMQFDCDLYYETTKTD